MQKSTAARAQTREENINIQDLGGKKAHKRDKGTKLRYSRGVLVIIIIIIIILYICMFMADVL